MDNWAICYILRNGNYEWTDAGRNIVINQQYDKVIPVREHVARQADKLIFDGNKLKVRDGETLLSKEELDRQQLESDRANGLEINEGSHVMEVEL